MAHRRMFSKAIVGSARFLKMPTDSQTLYFHLGMATDDDGIVEAWSVLKTTGSAEDNLRVLASKGFIKILNEDLVSYLMDWNEHNELRSDRIVPSQYRELLIQMVPDAVVKEPKRRADLKPLLESGRPLDVQWTEEDRLGEVRLINTSEASLRDVQVVSEEERPARASSAKYPHALEVFALWGAYPKNWISPKNAVQREAAENLYTERGIQAIKDALEWYEDVKDLPFCPQMTSPYDLDSKWDKLEAFSEKKHD